MLIYSTPNSAWQETSVGAEKTLENGQQKHFKGIELELSLKSTLLV
jgi:hypothetical protein